MPGCVPPLTVQQEEECQRNTNEIEETAQLKEGVPERV